MPQDHDLLIKIGANVEHILNWNENHAKEDDSKHKDNLARFDRIERTQAFHNKIVYMMLGALALLRLFIH